MPRTITVKFDDGTDATYQNVPDDVTPEQFSERAAADSGGKRISVIDGGRKAAPATAPAPVEAEDASPEYAPDGRKYSQAASRVEKMLRKIDAKSGKEGTSWLKGGLQSAATAATGLGAMAVGGLAGAARTGAAMVGGDDFETATDKGRKVVEKVTEAGTYQPRSLEGKVINEFVEGAGKGIAGAGGAAGGAVGGVFGEDARLAGEAIGEVAPAIIPTAIGLKRSMQKMGRPAPLDTRGAKKLKEAMDSMTPEELNQARKVIADANELGISLTGPEAFASAPKLHALLTDVDKANNIVSRFTKDRPEQAKKAISEKLDEVGDDVGLHAAANKAEETATTVITNAEKFRTEAAGPDYKAQRASDTETLGLIREIKGTQKAIKDGTAWKNDAIQQAGRWYQFSHEMGMKANEVAKTVLDWSKGRKRDADEPEVQKFEDEGGSVDKNAAKREQVQTYLNRAGEGASATRDAVNIARDRQNYIDGWKKELDTKADKLAEKNLDVIDSKVRGFMADLDAKIELAGATTDAGKILTTFKNELAAEGKPLVLPSQLESVYKSNRNKTILKMDPSDIERTTAGVLRGNVRALDALIQEVSPAIKQGRTIYAQVSKEFVDPLMKGPVGRIAGKGADAQKEATVSRVLSELKGKAATPDRIRKIADEFNAVDTETFPNLVRSHLQAEFNEAAKIGVGKSDRLTGAKFAQSIAPTPKDKVGLAVMIEKSAAAMGKSPKQARAAGRAFSNMIEVLESTGRVAKTGVQAMDDATLLDRVAPSLTHPGAYGAAKTWTKITTDFFERGAHKNLARVFTDPKSIDKMIELANSKATNKAAYRKLVAELLEESAAPAAAGAALAPGDDE